MNWRYETINLKKMNLTGRVSNVHNNSLEVQVAIWIQPMTRTQMIFYLKLTAIIILKICKFVWKIVNANNHNMN